MMPCDLLDSDSFFENGMESEGERKCCPASGIIAGAALHSY